MMEEPIDIVVKRLKDKGVPLSTYDALEACAREGNWHTQGFANEVKTLEAWEINPACENKLRQNLPNAKVTITDATQQIKKPNYRGKFNFIVLDCPMACFGEENRYSEHFEMIHDVPSIARDNFVLLFNVNKSPYDYDRHPAWKKRRKQFYGIDRTESISLEFLENHYKKLFDSMKLNVLDSFYESRREYEKNDFLYYMCFILQKS